MSYESQARLESDSVFQARARAAGQQQATQPDDDPQRVALGDALLRDEPGPVAALVRLDAAGPGIAEKVDTGDGTIDQALVTDADLLALTQANWANVAGLFFGADGAPLA